MTEQLSITISGPQGAGKTIVAHLLCGTLRLLGCKVELQENGERFERIDMAAAAVVHLKQPSILITTKQMASVSYSSFGEDPPLAHELQSYLNDTDWSFSNMSRAMKRYEFCLDPPVRLSRESELSEPRKVFLNDLRVAWRHFNSEREKKRLAREKRMAK